MFGALLTAQGLLALVWAFLMFRTLFRLRRRAVVTSGAAFPGLGATLESFAAFLRAPEYRSGRLALGLVTLALFAVTGAIALFPRQGL